MRHCKHRLPFHLPASSSAPLFQHSISFPMSRKIRYGMIGGGRGAFIGGVHRIAASIDGQIELVCGAFSSTPEKSKASGAAFFLPPDRCYGPFQEMIQTEAALPADKRMDFVSIVPPNHLHFPAAK